ncbi:MAG: 1-acyl-sn-glycerol-3-phosphate acyltransferase [Oscillospiraceae bacterium]|nr:1-acyl-sn-glycerol-3-phosphate acyltransferase [Oscillospiraceae bacterium]
MIIFNIIKKTAIFVAKKYYKINYYNTEKIPKNHGCLICCNHISNWDPVLIYGPIKTKIYFMAKNELFKFRPVGWILKQLGAFPVKRGKKDMDSINFTIDLINKNKFVVIFPEGTRSKTGEFLKPKSGATMVAYKTGANILPVRIIYYNKNKFRSRVDIIYGDLISPESLNISDGSLKDLKSASLFLMESIKNLKPNKKQEAENFGT